MDNVDANDNVHEDSIPIENDLPPRTQPILEQTRLLHRRGSRRHQGLLQEDSTRGAADGNERLPVTMNYSPSHLTLLNPSPPSSHNSSSVASSANIRYPAHQDNDRAITSINPQHLRHGISQDNQYIRRGIQATLARNYEHSPAIAVFSNGDGHSRRLFAGNPNEQLPPYWLQRQRQEEARLRQASQPFLLEHEIDQPREWLEVEFHPNLQSALLDRHHQHRDEHFLEAYAQHLKDGKNNDTLSPSIQEFLLEQARALERLTQQQLSQPSNTSAIMGDPLDHHHQKNESGQFLSQDHSPPIPTAAKRRSSSSSASVSMRIWMGNRSHASDRGSNDQRKQSSSSNVSELLLLPPSLHKERQTGEDHQSDDNDIDSRFSNEDYMTDYQWTALRLAIVKNHNNSSLVRKYQKALQASADLPSQPLPPKRHPISRAAAAAATTTTTEQEENDPSRSREGDVARRRSRKQRNYDHGDNELEPLVRNPSPPPDGEKEEDDRKPPPPSVATEESFATNKHVPEQIQLAMNEAIRNIPTRICPVCQQNILVKEETKSDGSSSNKVPCSLCGATSCYFCRQVIPATIGLDHFDTTSTCLVVGSDSSKCPLWTDPQTDLEHDKKMARVMLLEIADQVLQDTFHAKR